MREFKELRFLDLALKYDGRVAKEDRRAWKRLFRPTLKRFDEMGPEGFADYVQKNPFDTVAHTYLFYVRN